MPESPVQRVARLRSALTAFAMSEFQRDYREAHAREFPGIEPPSKPVPELQWRQFMEEFTLGGILPPGRVAGAFLEKNANLTRREQNMVRAWADAPAGVFRLNRQGAQWSAFSLVSEAVYPLAEFSAGEIPDGVITTCRLLSAGDGGYLAAAHAGIRPDDATSVATMLGAALGATTAQPGRAFRDNPARARRGRVIASARRSFFFELFLGDEKRGTGEEIAAAYARFRSEWSAREPSPVLYPDLMLEEIQPEIRRSADAAMLMDANGELFLLPMWVEFLQACSSGAPEEKQRAVVGLYALNAVGLSSAWERAIGLHPDGALKAVSAIIEPERAAEMLQAIPAMARARESFPPCVPLTDPALVGALPVFLKSVNEEAARSRKAREQKAEEESKPKLWVPGGA